LLSRSLLFAYRFFEYSKHIAVRIFEKAVSKHTAEIKRYPAFSSPWQRKHCMLPFRTENGGNVVSAGRFPPDLFRTIDQWHPGSILKKIQRRESIDDLKNGNKPTRPW
jgi:hypothetical protein